MRKLTDDERFMKEALRQAMKARALEEVPIGCVIVHDGNIIARGYNRRNTDKNTTSPRGDQRDPEGKQKAGRLEAGRVYHLHYPGALPDVCRGHCAGPD